MPESDVGVEVIVSTTEHTHAFAALPAGTVEGLLKDKAALTKILTYHVVPGRVAAADVVKLNFAETVNGQAVRIQTSGSNVMIDVLMSACTTFAPSIR